MANLFVLGLVFFVFCFFIIFLGYLNLVVSTSTPSRGLEETARTSYHMAQDRAQLPEIAQPQAN